MKDNLKYELIKRVASVPDRIRKLESWDSSEATSISEELAGASGGLQDSTWQPLRDAVQTFKEGLSSGELPREGEFIRSRDTVADGFDLYVSVCLYKEVVSLYEGAKKQRDLELAKNTASTIKALGDLLPESISRTSPKTLKRFKRLSLQYQALLEAVDRGNVLTVFKPEDEGLYRWRIRSLLRWRTKLRQIAIYLFLFWVVAIGVPLGVFLLIGLASETVAFWSAVAFSSVCIIVTLLNIGILTVGGFFPEARPGERNQEPAARVSETAKGERLSKRLRAKGQQRRAKARQKWAEAGRDFREATRKTSRMGIGVFASLSIGGLLYAISSPVDSVQMGFVGGVDSFAQWILFFVNTPIQLIALGIPESVGWSLSTIEAGSGYSRVATIVLQLCITASVVDVAIHIWSSFFRAGVYYGTTDGLFWNERFSPAKDAGAIVERVAEEVEYQAPDKVWLRDFVHVLEEHHKNPREKYTLLLDKLNAVDHNLDHPEQVLKNLAELESLSRSLFLGVEDSINESIQQLREAQTNGKLNHQYLFAHITRLKALITVRMVKSI